MARGVVVPRRGVRKQTFARSPQNGGLRRARAVAGARAIVAAPAGELKFFDTSATDPSLTATMLNTNLNIIPQGITNETRVGRKCVITALHMRGSYTLLPAVLSTATSCRVRSRIVLDTQTNLSDFTAAVFLESDVIDSFSKLANKGRFRVLSDTVYSLMAGGAAASGAAFVFSEDIEDVNINLRFPKGIPIEFNDTTADGAVTTQTSNSLHLIQQTSTAEIVTSSLNIRVRYLD